MKKLKSLGVLALLLLVAAPISAQANSTLKGGVLSSSQVYGSTTGYTTVYYVSTSVAPLNQNGVQVGNFAYKAYGDATQKTYNYSGYEARATANASSGYTAKKSYVDHYVKYPTSAVDKSVVYQ